MEHPLSLLFYRFIFNLSVPGKPSEGAAIIDDGGLKRGVALDLLVQPGESVFRLVNVIVSQFPFANLGLSDDIGDPVEKISSRLDLFGCGYLVEKIALSLVEIPAVQRLSSFSLITHGDWRLAIGSVKFKKVEKNSTFNLQGVKSGVKSLLHNLKDQVEK